MVSRRNLVTILLMMITVFFMFQFTQVIKVRGNQYDTNEYAKEVIQTADKEYVPSSEDDTIVFLGKTGTEVYDTVEEWCRYSKRNLKVYDNADIKDNLKGSHLILIDSNTTDIVKDQIKIMALSDYKIPIVFLNLPEVKKIRYEYKFREMLGITKVKDDEVEAKGFQAFGGFLLGGEAAYMPQKKEEEKYNDFDCNIPWYETGAGTKTYVVAMMDERRVKANDFPKLLWRNNYNGTFVFVVATDVINKDTGMGFLSAIDYSAYDYSLYPVVNAQNFVLSDYPVIANENDEKIEQIYSMDAMSLSRDITWPFYLSLSSRYKMKLTCFVNTGYNYPNAGEASRDYLSFYLQQVKEINGEFGRSLNLNEFDKEFGNKMAADEHFFEDLNDYHYSAAYINRLEDKAVNMIKEDGTLLRRIHTVVSQREDNDDLLGYLDDTVTIQKITNVADEYSYRKELRHRCMLTSIGYASTLVDMHKVLYPEKTSDEWQMFSKDVSSYIDTFWTRNDEFEYTAVSESDTRVRNFLNLDYNEERNGDTLVINLTGTDDAYFVLRTHDEDIVNVEGGDFTNLENNVFMIHAVSDTVTVNFSESKKVLKYDGLLK
ncbi:MAG: DUF2194 domain-containing protein [Lachnospiraceae bacterium]|nr:DUF2194 domain-containing protein [Lachnospiraceae bacterium]